MRNLDELNTKHDSVEFQYKISETSIFFMDTNRSTELPSHKYETSEIVTKQYSIQSSTVNQTNLYKIKIL